MVIRRSPAAGYREGLLATGVALVIGAATIAIAVAVPKPSIPLALGGIAVALLVGWLAATPHLEWSVTAVVIFLGCVNGPLKLVANAGVVSSGLQDVVVLAVTLGLIFRMIASRTPARLPPLSGWVIAWILFVLVESLNPETAGLLHALGGWRQELPVGPVLLVRLPADPHAAAFPADVLGARRGGSAQRVRLDRADPAQP